MLTAFYIIFSVLTQIMCYNEIVIRRIKMKSKTKSTVRKIEYHRKESFYLIVRGLEVGLFSGIICVIYRYLISFSEEKLRQIMEFTKDNPTKTVLWFFILICIGIAVALVNKFIPAAAGSGIPQVTGEIRGFGNPVWWKVIIGKFIGGSLAVFGGLSLGREGPSVQLGGMAAKGIARLTKADKTTELRMISCGAGAGMAAAFNAPLAGIMFVLEEIHHTFDKSILCMGIVATITADFVSKIFFGQSTTFNYDTVNFPLKDYWLLIILGVVLGISGVCYNFIMVKAQDNYKKMTAIPNYIKMPFIFIVSGAVGIVLPQILCGGHSMVELLLTQHPSLYALSILLISKFLFGVISFASGAPGGTLYPLCIIGAYIGAIFGEVFINPLGLGPEFYEEFVVIGMAGLFASIVRAPITGIVLVYELTGNMNNILPIATVSLISYAVANLIGVTPFYESLLERITNPESSKTDLTKENEKVIKTYVVPIGSAVSGKALKDIDWGKHCLVVTIERDGVSITPKGETVIEDGDELAILISQRRFSKDSDKLEKMIKG